MERTLVYATLEKDVAIMRLDKRIGANPKNPNESFINSSYFAEEMQWLFKQGKKIQVRINSIGGNVLKGWDIYDAVTMCEADTHCYGLAASMAGIILLAGKKRTADAHAIVMLHGAHDEEGKTDNPFVEKVNSAFKILLESRTNMEASAVDKILKKGDHYFEASDMSELGLVDSVIPSKIKINKKVNASLEELMNVYSTLENNNTMAEEKSPTWIEAIFGKKSDGENMSAAIKLKADLEAEQKEKAAVAAKNILLEAELNTLKDAQVAASLTEVKAKAKKLIEDAVTAKKLTLDAKQTTDMIAAAEQNYSAIETMINALGTGKRESVAAALPGGAAVAGSETKMSYQEMATKHPEALEALYTENPELFNEMADTYIKEQSKGKK